MEADGFSLHGGGRIYFASQPNDGWDSNMFWQTPLDNKHFSYKIGEKHALKKYDQLALNTSSLFWGSTRSNITPVVQFHGAPIKSETGAAVIFFPLIFFS